MEGVTRLWLLVPAEPGDELTLPAALELAAIVAMPAAEAQAARLAELRELGLELDEDLAHPDLMHSALDRWALRHAHGHCALLASTEAVQRAVGDALGVGDSTRFALRAGGCATLDWPLDDETAPALVGFDLDWVPVFLAKGRPKFPGGPGVASSGKA